MTQGNRNPSDIAFRSNRAASESAARIWALASAEYPERHQPIMDAVQDAITEEVSVFAVNARRVVEFFDLPQVEIGASRWLWESTVGAEKVTVLKHALDRILHARTLTVAFVKTPKHVSVIEGGGVVVPFLEIETDHRSAALVDLFSLAHGYLYQVLPLVQGRGHHGPTSADPSES